MEDAGVEVQTDFIRGAQGIQGDKGEQGEKGDKGDKGDKGEAFTYSDLTPEQIEELRQQLYDGLITQDEMDIILGGIETNLNTMQDNIEAEIQPLKENILSNNLFDGKLLTDKVHSSTGVITSSGISTNENYIPVKEGKSIAISNNGKAMACDIFFYNASYTYMSVVRSTSTTEVPTGASYVAFNVATADLTGNKIMVNYGTEPMEYEEYVNAIAELEAEIGTKINKLVSVTMLNTAGWYRVAKYNNDGQNSVAFILNINSRYSSNSNQSATINVNITYNKAKLTTIASLVNRNTVSKVRVVQENGICYIEVYYNASAQNPVLIDIISQKQYDSAVISMLNFEAPTDTATVLDEISIATQAISGSKVLWTNPNPTEEFPAQNITLSSSEYKYLEVYFKEGSSFQSEKTIKGYGTRVSKLIGEGNNEPLGFRMRTMTYVNDTTYSFTDGLLKKCNVTTEATVANLVLVPYQIIGYN